MNIISVDLGTTNLKAAVYDQTLQMLHLQSEPVTYEKAGDFVEFDADEYFSQILTIIQKVAVYGWQQNREKIVQIVLTGQAESLILLDKSCRPVCPGISWLDMRSSQECLELSAAFLQEQCYRITGQPELIPTWPITKILWMKKNRPDLAQKTAYYLLLKDYIAFRLCGKMAGDHSIYCFSHYFHITERNYWKEILDYCSVQVRQLPQLMPSGSIAGFLKEEFACPKSGLSEGTKINIGTLDHFAGMIGAGCIKKGQISESAGTVLSLAAFTEKPVFDSGRVANYCGPFPDSYVLLPVCESGGFSMEWFKNQFLQDTSYGELNKILKERERLTPLIFLPYLTGVNAPDYNEDASGVFFGIRAGYDRYDLAFAVMQGVACMLRKNLDSLKQSGVQIDKIISTGGGARSPIWTQLKADFAGHVIEVPDNEEAPCLGAAVMAAVQEGFYKTYEEAIAACVSIKHQYQPSKDPAFERTYQLFCRTYDALEETFRIGRQGRGCTPCAKNTPDSMQSS